MTAEKNKEILQKANETEVKSSRIQRARYEAQLKECNAKIERLEVELREKTQESKIASSKIRELQTSGTGLPMKRESVNLKPLKNNPTERSSGNGRLPSVGRVGTNEGRNRAASTNRTVPNSPAKGREGGSKTTL